MRTIMRLKFILFFASYLQISQECNIEGGLNLGPMPNIESIDDTYRGIIRSEATSNIQHIQSISYGGALLSSQPYLTITHENSRFVMQTSSAFDQYEANEVILNFSVTITFQCTGGNTSPLIFVINVADTNNNYPEFVPTNSFDFVVTAPLPPGFLLTGCLKEIIVRDIDLTTSSIKFEIEDNPYFEIEYDAASCPAPASKEFKAQLRTTTFIRSLTEPIALTITATDVDATGDPPLSTLGTIRISGDSQFVFPEEPVFNQTFYFASYTDDHQLIPLETISLKQGFDENVIFSLAGEYQSYFDVNPIGNQVSLFVRTPIPDDVLVEREIYVIVRADKEYTSGATATIIVRLPEETPLLFESAHFEGYIVDNNLELSPLVLSQGYEGVTVTVEIVGDYRTSFSATVQENLVTLTMTPLTDEIIEGNSFISIRVVASTGRSEALTIVNLEIMKDDNVTPVFDNSIYSGSYDPDNGLTVHDITFVQGYDETVSVDLLGEHRNLFQINDIGPIIRLTSSTIPPELFEEQRITLSIKASKPRTVGANAAVIITLPPARELDFEEITYRGTIHNDELRLQPIILREGYDQTVRFMHSGDYSTYFGVTNDLNEVIVTLLRPLPDSAVLQNSVLMLTLTASGQNAVTTSTTVILDIIKDDTATPVFSQNIYYGTYRGPSNFEIENISLAQGYDDELVSFKLDDSAHAKYFDISNTSNRVTISLKSAIPEDVIFDEKFLLFNVLADKELTVGANAAILIRFTAELTESTIMSFSKHYYVGAIKQNELTLENIILDKGYATGTEFVLSGDYEEHFDISDTNNVVKISIKNTNALPPEIVENNDFIILTVKARRQRAVSVWTSVVIGIVKEDIEHPLFNQAYYRGVYTEGNKLQFDENIYLSDGYDETVRFELEGEQAIWFSVEYEGNAVTLNLKSEIPLAVLEENNQLLFTIVAIKTNGISGHAVISIDLPKEIDIRFSQDYYRGYIEDGIPTLDDLSIEDFIIPSDVVPVLSGDYSDYFQVNNQNGNLKLELKNPIPVAILEENKLLILTLAIQYGNNRISTVIVLEVFHAETENVVLAFEKTYYVGSYNEPQGLQLDEIKITDVNFNTTTFEVEGEDAQWFGLERKENSVQLVLSSPIPPAVLANNQQLVFIVNAQRPGSTITRATIVISLTSEYTEGLVLGFDQVSYSGSIENDQATIAPIILSEGYVPGVEYALHGELETYFSLTPQEATVIVTLRIPIPEELIPVNRIIVLEIQASAPQTRPAYATLIFEHVVHKDPVVELIFAQTYYTGSYTETEELVFSTPISLAEGYDASVDFVLEGDQSHWFTLEGPGNAETLVLSSPIPPAVLANNQQLVFIVIAQRPGSTITRATIVISLTSEYSEGLVLGFDQVSYIGSIENDQATIAPIILSEGYVPGVEYAMHGELETYFSLTRQEATVTVTLRIPIPEELIPANRIIVLEIQASAPQTRPAYATLIFEHVVHKDPVVELIFAQTYYTGSYTETEELVFPTPISLAEGYDASVEFVLEGDQSHWFTLEGPGNAETLVLSSPIPPAVLANNQQLVFIVIAQRPGSTITRATIVISLTSEYTEGLVLGFDQVSYIGSIENDQATITPIILSEGYVPGVEYALHGELETYFSLTPQEATVTVTLRIPIPEELIPANRIIVLEIQASAPQTRPAYATLIFEHVVHKDPVVELIFAQTYYTGSYTENEELVFPTPISLAEGYDASVEFVLEGDQSHWFTLEGPGNAETLILSSPIPPAVLANNQQLVFIVIAQRPGSTITRATIVISLTSEYTEGLVLGFDQVSYIGSIENDQATITPIILSEGYVPGVEYALHGELETYFSLTPQEATVTVTLRIPIPEELIPANRIIVLEIQASAPQTRPAYATLIVEHIVHKDPVVELIFAQTYYTGSYTETEELVFPTPISLAEGYDASVEFVLEGDQSHWFTLEGPGNAETLVLSSPIPPAVLANNQQLVFIVNAQRPGSTITRATIVISLTSEYTEGLVLGFDQVSYIGSIENDQAAIAPIILSEGYVPGVEYALHGELETYFSLTPQEATVTVTLRIPIPEELIPVNRIIVLEIQASAPQTRTAYATLIFEHIVHKDPVVELIFAQTYYTGSYTETEELVFPTPISLAEGYDASVDFVLEGDQSHWFTLEGPGNAETLVLSSPIPPAVLANNQQLVFIVIAQRPGSTITRATIVISLTSEYTEGLVLGFDQVSYIGSIENDQATIPPIILSDGYVPGVEYALHGELETYFSLTPQEATVTVTLRIPIPEELIPANRIIVLEIQASAPQTRPAYATLIFEHIVHKDPVVELIFAQTYYTGSYTETEELVFPTPISLAEGYDASVEFVLEGDQSHWFTLEGPGNAETLVLSSPIPPAVLANNQQLVFIVNAQRPGSTITRATIVISLTSEYTEGLVLGFDQVSYIGSIENDQATIPPIILSDGYVPGVEYALHGELETYFSLTPQEATVTVTLRIPIPEELIPANRIIVLEIQASAPQTRPAYATLIFEHIVHKDPVVELIFAQTYYTGSYTETEELVFPTPISLAEGYDASVEFVLEGDQSHWFTLEGPGNAETLVLSSPIPPAVLANNQQLVFIVNAQRPGSTITRATIVISLTSEYTEGLVLGFDQVSYIGSIENDQAAIAPIILSEGYVPGVEYALHGELETYFSLTPQEATVTVTLRIPIPEELIPANRIIVLEIQASAPQTRPAYATLIVEHIVHKDPVVELIFAQTYYTGSYTETEELVFPTPISLAEGYDASVEFVLEGDQSHWFTLEGPGNAETLVLSSPIPPAVLANNQQLVFIVNAQRPGSTITRATIVISLTSEYTEGLVLGFDQVSYIGSIENDQAAIAPIILSEGYVPGVEYALHGELETYFSLTPQEATVTVTLRIPIPEELIPVNRIIVLEIQASAPQTRTAYATLIFEHVVHKDPVVELIFAQTYYTGSYTENEELVFPTPISLAEGYDASVEFVLEGDQSHWFTLEGPGNAETLVLSSPIPPAVLANNQQLVFIVIAQRPGSTITRATIVISLTSEYTEGLVLGFDQVSYIGSIENDQATIPPIILSDGYVPGVEYALHGELETYFSLTPQEATVTVTLRIPIPEELIPANRIIVLEIQASAPQTRPAYATLIFEHIVHKDPVVELIFAQTYYTGSYTETEELVFPTPISLAEGYDASVEFVLEGDQSHWFTLEGPGNAETLVLSSPIPPAVLANNQQLVFIVNAQRPGSTITRATIVISLTSEYTEGLVLGFDQVSYIGSIENDQAAIAPIILSEGYVPGVEYALHGELETYFSLTPQEATVTVTLRIPIPEELIPVNRIIVLEIQASAPQTRTAYATLIFEHVVHKDPVVELIFAQTYYTGSYTENEELVFPTPISLAEGYDASVEFVLEGDQSHWFTLEGPGNAETLVLSSPIPPAVLVNNQQLVFIVIAQRPGSTITRATIVISLTSGTQTGSDEEFDKFVYEGVIQNGVIDHERITITGFNGTTVDLYGEYESFFETDLSNGHVTVREAGSQLSLPSGITVLALELRAGSARAVLVLEVNLSGDPTPTVPVVTFSSSSYTVHVKITDTGLVGQVQASADNGEALRYSLQLGNAHLEERLIINDIGELHLSAPVNSGLYTFQVVATTIITLETGTATVRQNTTGKVHLSAEVVTPPLIVLDRDEEEAHYDLIQTYEGCHFSLSNRWPLEQTWLYVNETGLHTTAIDREHESIAFMTLSQVQVEIILHCDTDDTRVKRSLQSESLIPLDYGSSKWVLTDTIQYNSRRSLVNLIVNDINDNAPVFVGKEQEPIAVGYPVRELEERVLPRSLAELKATDADIGENAALLYWSSEPALAVAPATGFVHIRDGATLEHDARFTVHATDRNGQQDGLTGSVDIIVKLLDESNIAVVTVRDLFLDNESNVLSRLSQSVGYEIKVLRSVVISDDEANEVSSRKKREVSSATGALLQLYIYGLIDREPVSIEQLTADITNAVIAQVNIASTVSLEDHLAGQEICVILGRDTGLLVATIVLSVLLFIIIVLTAVWFFLRWRRKQSYDQFSDANSLASRKESVDQSPKPVDIMTKPRLNLEELKKSERRLQEMLDAPIQEVAVEPTSLRKDAILDMPLASDSNASIVIQSIDKLKDAADDLSDDEFGEIKPTKRKSVVTFNENVEKIIHIEDIDAPVESKSPGYEIYKL